MYENSNHSTSLAVGSSNSPRRAPTRENGCDLKCFLSFVQGQPPVPSNAAMYRRLLNLRNVKAYSEPCRRSHVHHRYSLCVHQSESVELVTKVAKIPQSLAVRHAFQGFWLVDVIYPYAYTCIPDLPVAKIPQYATMRLDRMPLPMTRQMLTASWGRAWSS